MVSPWPRTARTDPDPVTKGLGFSPLRLDLKKEEGTFGNKTDENSCVSSSS